MPILYHHNIGGFDIPVNDTLLIAAGFPKTLGLARQYYAEDKIIPLAMSEFQKMDGGLSCLSLRY